MRCTVLLFAQLRDAAKTDRVEIDLAPGATVADLLDALDERVPEVTAWRDRIAVAVDERYRARNTVLHEGCTIALIPPVSGG